MAHRPLAVASAGLIALSVLWPSATQAYPIHRRGSIIFGGFYDPFFFAPYPAFGWGYGWGYPYGMYRPYGYYGPYAPRFETSAEARLLVTPRNAEVYVDGYRAGIVDDFDGAFQRLHATPGGHEITLYLKGYRTISEKVYLSEGSTMKIRETMEKLGPGETSQPPPAPPAPRHRTRERADETHS